MRQRRTPPLGFTDVSEKPSFFFTVPARNPRTLCCCQSVACIISAMLAPAGWLNRVSTRSCRLRLGASLLGGGALKVTGLRDGKGRHGFGLPWFAASELTLARSKAPHIARRALGG